MRTRVSHKKEVKLKGPQKQAIPGTPGLCVPPCFHTALCTQTSTVS